MKKQEALKKETDGTEADVVISRIVLDLETLLTSSCFNVNTRDTKDAQKAIAKASRILREQIGTSRR